MADDFTRNKFLWLDQVLADQALSPQAFATAYVLATRFLNRKTEKAWPAIATLANLIHRSERRAQDAVTELIKQGHLTYEKGGRGKDGQGRANRYKLAFINRTKVSDEMTDQPDESVRSNSTITRHFQHDHRTKPVKSTGRFRLTNPMKEPFDEPHDDHAQARAPQARSDLGGVDDDCEEFFAKAAKSREAEVRTPDDDDDDLDQCPF